jgi:membrane protein DedA with SNARE-associated domain
METHFVPGIIIGSILGCIIGYSLGWADRGRIATHDLETLKKSAIEVGAAYYHPTTGVLVWKNQPVVEPENAKK